MAQRLKLILCTALSLPLAISKQDTRESVEQVLSPLIHALFVSKQIKSVLAISGHLLDWCAKYRREYIQAIKELFGENRIELLSSGYYDPILPLIPRTDSIEQIERTSTAISKLYRRKPRGVWMNRLLWESSLTTALTKCAMNYTFLKDTDFVDYREGQPCPTAPMITEHAGKSIVVFPIATRLCKLWSEHKFRLLIRELRALYEAANEYDLLVVTLADDSEKRQNERNIQRFFQLLTDNADWLQTIRPADVPADHYTMETGYFHSHRLQKLRRNVSRNGETGHIYATMHYNHELASQLRGDRQKKRLAKELVLQGQNYYSFTDQNECRYSTQAQRKYAYSAFIEATNMFYREKQKRPTITTVDYDFDGVTECLFKNEKMHSVVHRKGGMITALSTVAGKWSWLDMSSIMEMPRQFDNRGQLPRLRNCGLDYLMPRKSAPHKFFTPTTDMYSLANHLFKVTKVDQDQSAIHLQTNIELKNDGDPLSVDLKKQIKFMGNTVIISYQLQNNLDRVCKTVFATQLSVSPSLTYFDDVTLDYVDIATKAFTIPSKKTFLRLPEIAAVHVRSTQQKHRFICDCAGSDTLFLYRFQERKAITMVPCWNLLLGPQDSRSLQVIMEINRVKRERDEQD